MIYAVVGVLAIAIGLFAPREAIAQPPLWLGISFVVVGLVNEAIAPCKCGKRHD